MNIRENLLNCFNENMYQRIDNEYINYEMNVYYLFSLDEHLLNRYLKICKNDKLPYILEEKKSLILRENEKLNNYLNDNREEIIKVLKIFLDKYENSKLSLYQLKDPIYIEDKDFKYHNKKFLNEIKNVVEHKGLLFINTTNKRFADILVISYIYNNRELCILTDDISKKENLEKFLNQLKIERKNEKSNEIEIKSNELNDLINKKFKIRNNELKDIIDEDYSLIEASIKEMENLLNIKIGKDIIEYMEIFSKIKSSKLKDKEEKLMEEFRIETDEVKKYNITEQIREIRNNIEKLSEVDEEFIIKNNIDKDRVLEKYDELKEIYLNIKDKAINLIEEREEELENAIKLKKGGNKIIDENLIYIYIKDKNVSIREKVDSNIPLIINNVERYEKNTLEKYINKFEKVILIGNIENSQIKEEYEKINLKYRWDIYESCNGC